MQNGTLSPPQNGRWWQRSGREKVVERVVAARRQYGSGSLAVAAVVVAAVAVVAVAEAAAALR